MVYYDIDFEAVWRRGVCLGNQSLLDWVWQPGVGIVSLYGDWGLCRCCNVQVLERIVSEPSPMNEYTPIDRKAMIRYTISSLYHGDSTADSNTYPFFKLLLQQEQQKIKEREVMLLTEN